MPRVSISEEEIRSALLNAATDLFLEKGIAGTEMKEIAEKAGLSRSTLYRYAIDKGQLAFLVVNNQMSQLVRTCISAAETEGATGKEQLMTFCFLLVDHCEANPQMLHVINEFDAIYTGAYPAIDEARDYVITIQQLHNHTLQLVLRALADHSLHYVSNPSLFAATLANIAFGMSLRFFPREAHYQEEQHFSGRAIISEAIHALLDDA